MSRLNLDQLKAFLYVIRLGGVGKAASGLNLTQPAVSARLRNLEETIGEALFERDEGQMRLTKRGEILRSYAEQFEHLSGLMTRDVIDPDTLDGRLRLGVSETIAQCWLSDLVKRLHGLYPNLEIELNVDISIALRTGLLNRSFDLVILLGPVSEYSVENVELPGFDLAWYVSSTAEPGETPRDYLQRPVVTYARQTRPYREMKEWLFEHVGPEARMFPSSSLSTGFRLVEDDLGVAALPRALGQAHVARGTIREFDPGWHPRPLLFTASYLSEPKNHVAERAAQEALAIAERFHAHKNSV
ncbi:MAG: LysR family transcriptional regulator [Paracoccaceae bacterium]